MGLEHSTSDARTIEKVFELLKSLGCPVRRSEGKHHDRGLFWICGESGQSNWLCYYDNYEGSVELQQILEENGMYFEWEDPGFAIVYWD